MKKMMFGVAALIVIGITGMTGLLNVAFHMDDISDQEYRISLKKAAAIEKTKQKNITYLLFILQLKKTWIILRMQHMNTSFFVKDKS
ncbi:hypothetical protein EDAG_05554 [Enterococcus faecium D344SRF]|nr:hypothetical protein EDAG_05554 [Enterococcus faecium D344SRF]EQV60026.1 hypothetical protein EFZG_03941 [Enterococcus faecium TC 6]